MSGAWWPAVLGFAAAGAAVAATVAATAAVVRFARRPAPSAGELPPVTVLKPLYGADPELYENLLSFCRQSYSCYQVVFGVRDRDDPAVPVVRRLRRELPEADLELVIESRLHGANRKVSNLINMLGAAKHDVLVIADSDVRVSPDYLREVVAPLADKRVGLVTCLYKAVPGPGLWSRLHALWINGTFLPAAVLGDALGIGNGCFGATVALRRRTLREVGGFEAVADRLADDHALGALVRGRGLEVVVARHLVELRVEQRDLASLWSQELRWARTIQVVAPLGHAGSVLTHGPALALVAVALDGFSGRGLALLAVALLARAAALRGAERALGLPAGPLWLLPVRDSLSAALFVASFTGRRVRWRDRRFVVDAEGNLVPEAAGAPEPARPAVTRASGSGCRR